MKEPVRVAFPPVHQPPAQGQRHRARMAEMAFHQVGAQHAREAHVDFRLPHARARMADAQIGEQGDLVAGRGGDAIHRRDAGLVEPPDRLVEGAQPDQPFAHARFVESARQREVHAGAEGLVAGARQHHRAAIPVFVAGGEGGARLVGHHAVERVARRRPVEDDRGHGPVPRDLDGLRHDAVPSGRSPFARQGQPVAASVPIPATTIATPSHCSGAMRSRRKARASRMVTTV